MREIRGTVKGLAGWADWPYDLVEDAELGLTEKIDNVFKSPKIVRISENQGRWLDIALKNLPEKPEDLEKMADEMAKALSEYERSEEIFESDAILGSETAKWVASFMRQVQTPR